MSDAARNSEHMKMQQGLQVQTPPITPASLTSKLCINSVTKPMKRPRFRETRETPGLLLKHLLDTLQLCSILVRLTEERGRSPRGLFALGRNLFLHFCQDRLLFAANRPTKHDKLLLPPSSSRDASAEGRQKLELYFPGSSKAPTCCG